MTSLAELFDDITVCAWTQMQTGHVDPNDAARALHQAARLIDRIADGPFDRVSDTRRHELTTLARRCRQVPIDTSTTPSGERLGDLMAAAADLVATMTPAPSPGECWAIAVAALDPIRSCATLVRETASDPAIVDIGLAVNRLHHMSDTSRAHPHDAVRLDQARPATQRPQVPVLDRVRVVTDELAYRATVATLSPTDARLCAAAGLNIALYARPIEIALAGVAPEGAGVPGCDAMVAAWFTARDTIRDANPIGRQSSLAAVVAELSHDLSIAFGPASGPDVTARVATPADLATTYRAVTNRLPELSRAISQSARQWAIAPPSPAIDVRELIPWRDRSGITRYARVPATEVPTWICRRVAQAATTAGDASLIVAVRADRTAMRVGTQPHSYLAKAHAAELAAQEPPRRWRPLVQSIDEQVIADPSWPNVAYIIDEAAGRGWDVATQLPALARDLPQRRPALELSYRIQAHVDLGPRTRVEPPPSEGTPAARHGGKYRNVEHSPPIGQSPTR